MFKLTGKCALVTGASGAIGAAIAQALHRQGARVALSGTNIDSLQALKQTLGEGACVLPCDLSDHEALAQLVPQAEDMLGGLDILINNAGVTRDGLMMRMKDEDWDVVLAVNLGACFRLSRAVLKGMMKQRYGRIINMASVVGVMGNAGQANYAASKAGMIGMSKALAAEVASRHITVNCVAPGFITTPMTAVLNDAQKDLLKLKIPSGSLGTPDDIAAVTVFLASQEAGYVTGQTLHVNGGMLMV